MAQLLVRELDEEIVRALKRRSAEHGRSMEAEQVLASMPAFDDDGDLFDVR